MAVEVRWGLALNGGVSLAIWIGGLCDELMRLVHAGSGGEGASPEYAALCAELDVIPKIDVIAGTSAGGVNGAFLATALANGCSDLAVLRRLWIDTGAFSKLLREPKDQELPSLMRGDSYFLVHIEEALAQIAESGTGYRAVEPPLEVHLTATSLAGRRMTIPDGPTSLHTLDHRVDFHFTNTDFDYERDPKSVARVARACRSTASFPGAFEPSPVAADLFEEQHSPAAYAAMATGTEFLVDGGVLANLPAAAAVDAIIGQPSRERVQRVLGLVVPDPGGAPSTEEPKIPGFADAISASAVGIPRNQTLVDFVGTVEAHNQEVLGRRAARVALLRELAALPAPEAWHRFRDTADLLFPAYRAARHRTSIDRMSGRLTDRLPAGASAGLRAATGADDLDVLPWVPRTLDDRSSWGGSPVRRLAALLISWSNIGIATAAAAGDDDGVKRLVTGKESISDIRSRADALSPRGVLDQLVAEELTAGTAATGGDAVRAASARWAAVDDGAQQQQIAALLDELTQRFDEIIEALRPHAASIPDPDEADSVAGLLALHDGAPADDHRQILVAIEVVEVAFSAADPRPDQTIRLAQFSATRPVTIDPTDRDEPAEKLAGVQLGHFAAFLKRSWRANDFMWGRLDAAERAVRLLDQVMGGPLEQSGRLEHHLRATQAVVLRQELPAIVDEIQFDVESGAKVSPDARAFVDAVIAAGEPARPGSAAMISLEHADQDTLSHLLGLNRIGLERVESESGTRLTVGVAMTAIATGAELLRRQGPPGIRAFIGVLSTLFGSAWRFTRMARRSQLLLISSVLAVVALSVVTVVADLRGRDPGWVVIPAWVIIVLFGLYQLLKVLPGLRALFTKRR